MKNIKAPKTATMSAIKQATRSMTIPVVKAFGSRNERRNKTRDAQKQNWKRDFAC